MNFEFKFDTSTDEEKTNTSKKSSVKETKTNAKSTWKERKGNVIVDELCTSSNKDLDIKVENFDAPEDSGQFASRTFLNDRVKNHAKKKMEKNEEKIEKKEYKFNNNLIVVFNNNEVGSQPMLNQIIPNEDTCKF